MADRTVLARNFPQAWVSAAALPLLAQRLQSLLQRIGPLQGLPKIYPAACGGYEGVATFADADHMATAVDTLHGTDLRSPQEKKAAGFQPPKENERFCLRLAEANEIEAAEKAAPIVAAAPSSASSPVPAAAAAAAASPSGASPLATRISASPTAAAAAAPSVADVSSTPGCFPPVTVVAPQRSRPLPTGIVISPFPSTWTEGDVQTLTKTYGQVVKVKMHTLPSGVKGAYVNFASEANAKSAWQGLHGLHLLGSNLRCKQQEQLEAQRPTERFVLYIDELIPAPPHTPSIEPRLDDREVFIHEMPKGVRKEEAARTFLATFGDVEQVWFVKDSSNKTTSRAYVRFRHHWQALSAVRGSEATLKVTWSASERVRQGVRGAYGIDIVKRLVGENQKKLEEVVKSVDVASISLTGFGGSSSSTAGKPPKNSCETNHVHFVLQCDNAAQADRIKAIFTAEMAKAAETYNKDVKGSLVLGGFPKSWNEKGLKFVFAPFGGLSSLIFDEDRLCPQPRRLAYVKARNQESMLKAASSLHHTKVGDGDIVEQCVVDCMRYRVSGWTDGSLRIGFFVDELVMKKRPFDLEPGPEDRELFVRNLPMEDSEPQILEYFQGFGEVEDLNLIKSVFTEELTLQGYVRFKRHADAVRCIESLTPEDPEDIDPTDLVGAWSESERILQRKENCYKYNLITEIVQMDGSGLEKIKKEAKLEKLWLMSESLQQKDLDAPPLTGRQVQFVGKATQEGQIKVLKELLEKRLEETHKKISNRLSQRKRKAAQEAAAKRGTPLKSAKATQPLQTPSAPPPTARTSTNGLHAPAAAVPPAVAANGSNGRSNSHIAHTTSSPAAAPVAPAAPAPPGAWMGAPSLPGGSWPVPGAAWNSWQAAAARPYVPPMGMPPVVAAPAPPPGVWDPAARQAAQLASAGGGSGGQASVFEMSSTPAATTGVHGDRGRSRSRRRRRTDEEKRNRSGSRRRRK